MKVSHKRIIICCSSIAKTLLVAGMVFAFGWSLVHIAEWKSRKPAVEAAANGEIVFPADSAEIHGKGEARVNNFKGQRNIGWWDMESQWLAWAVNVKETGQYEVKLHYARHTTKEIDMEMTIGETTLKIIGPGTDGWDKWKEISIGTMNLTKGKEQVFTLKAVDLPSEGVINLVTITLTPEDSE